MNYVVTMLAASSVDVRIHHNIMVNYVVTVLAASSVDARIHHNIMVNWTLSGCIISCKA